MNLLDHAKKLADGVEIITEWLGDGAETVPFDQAQARANTCIECPLNTHSGTVSEAVAQAIKRQVEIKTKLSLHVDGERFLGRCAVCLCETKLKIWVPLERIKPEADELPKFHEKCWLRTEG